MKLFFVEFNYLFLSISSQRPTAPEGLTGSREARAGKKTEMLKNSVEEPEEEPEEEPVGGPAGAV